MTMNYNPRLETEVISGVMCNPKDLVNVMSFIGKSAFSHTPYRILWEAIEDMDDRGIDVSSHTIINHLERTGMLAIIVVDGTELRGADAVKFLFELPDDNYLEKPSLESLAKQLQDVVAIKDLGDIQAILKAKIDKGESPPEIIAYLDAEIGKISSATGANVGTISDAKTATTNFFERFQAIVRGDIKPFVLTGLKAIDETIGGVGKGKVILISGTSGDGKTVLAQNLLSNMSIDGDTMSAFIKMEGREFEAMARFSQIVSGVDALDIERGTVSETDEPRLADAMKKLKNGNFIINAAPAGMTMRQLKNQIMKLSALGVEVILIDQLNNLELETDKSSYLDADKKGYLIKKWAEEFDVGILAVHQLNKSTNSVHRKGAFDVSLADLAESGEKAMDAVFFVRHDETKTLIMCVKSRVGEKVNVRVNFDPIFSKYTDWNERYEEQPFGQDEGQDDGYEREY